MSPWMSRCQRLRDEVRRSGGDPGGASRAALSRLAARAEAERLWPVHDWAEAAVQVRGGPAPREGGSCSDALVRGAVATTSARSMPPSRACSMTSRNGCSDSRRAEERRTPWGPRTAHRRFLLSAGARRSSPIRSSKGPRPRARPVLVTVPFAVPRHARVLTQVLWRLLDLEESDGLPIDLVVATKFVVRRASPERACGCDQFRQAYGSTDRAGQFASPSTGRLPQGGARPSLRRRGGSSPRGTADACGRRGSSPS